MKAPTPVAMRANTPKAAPTGAKEMVVVVVVLAAFDRAEVVGGGGPFVAFATIGEGGGGRSQ